MAIIPFHWERTSKGNSAISLTISGDTQQIVFNAAFTREAEINDNRFVRVYIDEDGSHVLAFTFHADEGPAEERRRVLSPRGVANGLASSFSLSAGILFSANPWLREKAESDTQYTVPVARQDENLWLARW